MTSIALAVQLVLSQPNVCPIEGPPAEECEECPPSTVPGTIGDPVSMTTGYSFHIVDDLTVDTGEGPFTLRRFFMPIGAAGGSKSPLNTVIGAAWPAGVPDSPHGTVAGEVRPTWSNNLYSFIVPVVTVRRRASGRG